jgi:Na+-driven multidrug efflux pump
MEQLLQGISYFTSFFSFILWYFIYKTELKLQAKDFKFHLPIIKEITSLSLVSFFRQECSKYFSHHSQSYFILLWWRTFYYCFYIISKTLIFALFPVLGITQFYSIAGYNYGAENYERVKESIQISIKYAALLATLVLSLYSITPLSLPFY